MMDEDVIPEKTGAFVQRKAPRRVFPTLPSGTES